MTDLWCRFVQLSQVTKTFLKVTLGTSHLKMMTYMIYKICLHQEFFVFFKEMWLKEMLHF